MTRGLATDRAALLGAGVVFAGAVAIGIAVVRPLEISPIGPDAAAPVIEFQRLVAGQRLEGYLTQTSKPLLTVVYGVARVLTDDWRPVSLAAIGSFGLFVALASFLAHRLAGVAAAAFVAVALGLSPLLLRDVTFAYGVSWALLACAVGGITVTADRPRFGVAGVALAAGALARPEVLAVTAVALGWVVLGHLAARLGLVAAPPRRAWLLTIGFLAVPVLCAHDWALTGDPLFWANTAQNNSLQSGHIRSLPQMIVFVLRHTFGRALLLLPLVALGIGVLLARRRWMGSLVVTIVPVAVALFYTASGARGTVVSARYLLPVDLGLVFAAGIGLGVLDLPEFRRRLAGLPRSRFVAPGLIILLGMVVALVLAPSWPRAGTIRASVDKQIRTGANAATAFAVLERELGAVPAWRGVTVPADAHELVLIPARQRAQGIVDLDLPLWAGRKSFGGAIAPDHGLPAPGTIVYHDASEDRPRSTWRQLEVTEPTVIGTRRFVPVFIDRAAGIWILRVEDAGG